ncbi:MAG: hypothetical protein ACLSCV_06500 [Acutalibacteraceae bacterium]
MLPQATIGKRYQPIKSGAEQLAASTGKIGELQSGISSLNTALSQLNDGGKQVADGTATLSSSSSQLTQLQQGVGSLNSALGQLSSGASQLYQGSSELTNGVSSAQDGVVQLDDGVTSAKENWIVISETSEKLKATDGLKHTLQMEYRFRQIHMKQFLITEPHLYHTSSQCRYGPAAYPF